MRFLTIALFLAGAARASENGVVVRPLAGVGASLSDSGLGLGAQLGVRISPVLVRVTAEAGGNNAGPHGYFLGTVRAGWLHPLSESTSLLLGIGWGELTYGFVFDDPTRTANVLTPEAGLLLGPNRWFGRILVGATGFIPLQSIPRVTDRVGQVIGPPHVMATILVSL
jgi:hypothetical protein